VVTQTEFDDVFPSEATTQDKQVFDLLNTGDAFVNPVASGTSQVINNSAASIAGIDTLLADPFISPGDAAALTSLRGSLSANFTSGPIVTFQEHTNQITSLDTTLESGTSINKRLMVAQNTNLAINSFGIPTPDPSNPCLNGLDMFRSVLAEGQALIAQATQVASDVLAAVNAAVAGAAAELAALVAAAAGFISDITAAATDLANRVAEDVQAFLDGIDLLIKTSFARVLGSVSVDPCMQALLDNVGTPLLKSTLQI
jgi:hypothetical protein